MTLFWQRFCDSNFLRKMMLELISRNILSVRENFRNFHTVCSWSSLIYFWQNFRESNVSINDFTKYFFGQCKFLCAAICAIVLKNENSIYSLETKPKYIFPPKNKLLREIAHLKKKLSQGQSKSFVIKSGLPSIEFSKQMLWVESK